MKIEVIISTLTLGDFNTAEENQRYADAVLAKLQSEYPDADVSVELVENVSSGSCWVSDDLDGEIKENVELIVAQVWEKGVYY